MRRASIAQGKALLALFERCFASRGSSPDSNPAAEALRGFHVLLRAAPLQESDPDDLPISPHFAPLYGAVCRHLAIGAEETAYIFLLGHVKAVLSAAVRANVLGPYQSQALLARDETAKSIRGLIKREWDVLVEDAGQVAPVLDLWGGRHELLYSRIFNS